MTALLLAFALLCPPDGEIVNSYVFLRVTINGVSVNPAQTIPLGSMVRIEADVAYAEWDLWNRRGLAFSGGRLLLKINGDSFNIAPTNGLPLIGPSECAPSRFFRASMDYQATNQVGMVIAEHHYAGCGFGCETSSVVAVMALRVTPLSPVAITKSTNTVTLSFWAARDNVEIQASTNAVDWATVDTVSPVNGRVEWTTATEGARNLFRLKGL